MASRSKSPDETRVVLSGELNIGRVLEIREKLLSCLQKHASIEIDVQKVTDIGPAFLQLFCSAHRAAAGQGKSLTILGLDSPSLRQQLSDGGFSRHTGCTLDCSRSCIWAGAEGCP